jgi:hypothetical protein
VDPASEEPRERRFEPTADERREWREPTPDDARERRFSPATTEPSADVAPIELPPDPITDPIADPTTERPPDGRRTVVIRGRGAEPDWTPRARPPRTVGERIGPRPDRVAAWAVALGMLLILIAILTAHG